MFAGTDLVGPYSDNTVTNDAGFILVQVQDVSTMTATLPLARGRYRVDMKISADTIWFAPTSAELGIDDLTFTHELSGDRENLEDVSFVVDVDAGPHTINISLLEDLYTPSCPVTRRKDRNLLIAEVVVTPVFACGNETAVSVPALTVCDGLLTAAEGPPPALSQSHYINDNVAAPLVGLTPSDATLCLLRPPTEGALSVAPDGTVDYIGGNNGRDRATLRLVTDQGAFIDRVIVVDSSGWNDPAASARSTTTVTLPNGGVTGQIVPVQLHPAMAALHTCYYNITPVFLVDGETVAFEADADGADGLFWVRVDVPASGSVTIENYVLTTQPGPVAIKRPDMWTDAGYGFVHHMNDAADGNAANLADTPVPPLPALPAPIAEEATFGSALRFSNSGIRYENVPLFSGVGGTTTTALIDLDEAAMTSRVLLACKLPSAILSRYQTDFTVGGNLRSIVRPSNEVTPSHQLEPLPALAAPLRGVYQMRSDFLADTGKAGTAFWKDGVLSEDIQVNEEVGDWGPMSDMGCSVFSVGVEETLEEDFAGGLIDELRVSDIGFSDAHMENEAASLLAPFVSTAPEVY